MRCIDFPQTAALGLVYPADRSSKKDDIKLPLFVKPNPIIVYLYTTKVWDDFYGHRLE
jgi:hypothetical protein